MMKSLRYVLLPALVLALAIPVMAQEKAKHGRKKAGQKAGRQAQILNPALLKALNLTEEQTAKLKAIGEEVKDQLQEARKAVMGILTEEQKKARQEAEKAAKEAGKAGKELRAAVDAAVQLTDEQKTKMQEARKKLAAVQKEIVEKLMPVLTPEQQETVKSKMARGGRGAKARGGKKKKSE